MSGANAALWFLPFQEVQSCS